MTPVAHAVPGGVLTVLHADRLVVTRFLDATHVEAAPQDGAEDRARAEALGYPDVWQMTLHHDPTHHFLAKAVGLLHSPSLWDTAHQQPSYSAELRDAEEAVVLGLQRLSNLGGAPRLAQWLRRVAER